MKQSANKAAASKAAATETKKMTAAEISKAAANVMTNYRTMTAVRDAASKLRHKYGADNWRGIFEAAKKLRCADIEDAAKRAKENVFSYRNILKVTFEDLRKDANYKRLCKFAAATYKGTPADVAAAVVKDYFTNVNAAGMPVRAGRFLSASETMIYEIFAVYELTATDAINVLQTALRGMEKAAKAAARTGKDSARAVLDNVREIGTIRRVWAVITDKDKGTIAAGRRLDTKDETGNAGTAAKLIGKAVDADKLQRVSAYNAAALEAYREKAAAALAREKAAETPVKSAADKHAAKDSAPVKSAGNKADKAAADKADKRAAAASKAKERAAMAAAAAVDRIKAAAVVPAAV